MGWGLFDRLLGNLKDAGRKVPDARRAGHNRRYEKLDAILSAFAVFFFQYRALLYFQREMQHKRKRDNVQTIFGAFEIPSDPQITTLLDDIDPEIFGWVFRDNLRLAWDEGMLKDFLCLDEGALLAADGVWYHSSEKVSCERCLKITKDGVTTYYHSAMAVVMVRPGCNDVIPLTPEMIVNMTKEERKAAGITECNEEEEKNYEKRKQDCERKAFKRWFAAHADEYAFLKPTFLGDALYACHDICKMIADKGMSFLFTCKDDSHKWIAEQVKYGEVKTKTVRVPASRSHKNYNFSWVNGIENRADGEKLTANWVKLEIFDSKTNKVSYKCAWITDKEVNEDNVEHLVKCARARWKIENEHNNVLKNHGYNLEHNFGHGKNHASENYCILNMLALMFHTLLALRDLDYQEARKEAHRMDMFFVGLQFAMQWFLFKNWTEFIHCVRLSQPPGENS